MKKAAAAFVSIVMIVVLALPAVAAEEGLFEDGFDVLEYWSENGIPYYVTGIWATEGGYMVGLVEGPVGEAAKEEILASMEKDLYLRFTYQTYPLWELEQVMEELKPYFVRNWGLCGAGVCQQENVVSVGIDPDNPMAGELEAELTARFGDKIQVREGEVFFAYKIKEWLSPGQVTLLVTVFGALALSGLFLCAALRRRGVQTVEGCVVARGVSFSRKAAEAAVRKAEEYPDTTLRDIVQKLEK